MAGYTIGRGKPPLHTRFRKGQSGNPSGKPGPAKLARQRFERALAAALESSVDALAHSKPANVLEAVTKQLALDAVAGRTAAQRLLLACLDSQCEEEGEAENFSLVQGKKQGMQKTRSDEPMRPQPAGRAHDHGNSPPGERRNEAVDFSLVQGKKQGSEKRNAARNQLLMSASAIPPGSAMRFGLPPPARGP